MTGLGELGVALGVGALSAVGLLLGAVGGTFLRLPHHAIALVMSVGAGTLLAAASVGLATEAIAIAGAVPAISLLLLGAAVFSTVNTILSRLGAANRKRCGDCEPQATEEQQPGSGLAIAIGTAIDAVPEALVLGLTLRLRGFPLELLVAIGAGNLAEALSGAAGMRAAARSQRYILLLWGSIAVGIAIATALGRALVFLGPSSTPQLQAFGAGALLAMTAETMIPEAFHKSPRFSGFLAAAGFGAILLIEAAAG